MTIPFRVLPNVISDTEPTPDAPVPDSHGSGLRAASVAESLDAPESVAGEDRKPVFGTSRDVALRRALAVADLLAVSLAWMIAGLAAPPDQPGAQLTWGLAVLPGAVVLAKLYGLYDRDAKRLSHRTLDDVPGLLHVALLTTLALWGWLKAMPTYKLVLSEAILFLLVSFVCMLLLRALTRRLAHRLVPVERALLAGTGDDARMLLAKLRGGPYRRTEVVGYVADTLDDVAHVPRLGGVGDIWQICQEQAVKRVIIASSTLDPGIVTELIRDANQARVNVSLLPSVVDTLGPSTEVDDIDGVVVLGINAAYLTRSSRFLKRALDLVVSAAALVILLPLLPLVALAIKLDSPGPVFFVQERIGRKGRPFRLFKLRTMVADAESRTAALRADSEHFAWLLLASDPRITRLGGWLRRTSVDELPQLWNVLRGEMSLVGPRPMPRETHEHVTGWGRRRLDLTPGITGLWQVLGRTALPFEEMLKLDYLYVTNWSLWTDVQLLIRTVSVVLTQRGAG